MSRDVVKQELLAKLKQEHCFWSYNENLIKDIPDDMLIEKTLLHLDLEEINQLFLIYPFKKIKQVWLDYLVPQAEYLYTLNRFFAWYYFKAKKPDAYIKSKSSLCRVPICNDKAVPPTKRCGKTRTIGETEARTLLLVVQ